MANMSPPIPTIIGSTTVSTAASVTAASMALPPSCITRMAALVASGWLVAATPFGAYTTDLPAIVGGRGMDRCCPNETDATRNDAATTSLRIEISLKSFQVARLVDIDRPRTLHFDGQDFAGRLDQATGAAIS